MRLLLSIFVLIGCLNTVLAQTSVIQGTVKSGTKPIVFASIAVLNSRFGTSSDSEGRYRIEKLPPGKYTLMVSAMGYGPVSKDVTVIDNQVLELDLVLSEASSTISEVVVSGTMKEVSRLASPVPVEVYSPAFFRKNPTPSIFDALQNVNGVRPQLNCNVCNTGDIHINGLEGPYTMILIDGMPIVSGLSSVYGLSGIPNALIERVEIVKGPASSLYGSEAVGGLINIITKKPENAPALTADVFSTSWGELNTDLGIKLKAGKYADILTGINYFNYSNRIDNNDDNFTDIALQDRISVFQKWSFKRKENRLLSLAGRYNYEDRWGGDKNWDRSFRGGTERYAESIYTNRWELLGTYQLPLKEPVMLAFSLNDHAQNSVYGNTLYNARQKIAFGQLSWDKKINGHDLLLGTALRYTFYNDNTPATASLNNIDQPDKVWLPGIFIQDEISLSLKHKVLLGIRYDYNSVHRHILTPRIAYKWNINDNNVLRVNAGTGFRVVSLFTEEHAAITGSREVVVNQKLEPERSYNANLNFNKKIYFENGSFMSIDASAWYTYFNNQIIPDYLTNPDQIIYSNLNGYAVSRGLSANLDVDLNNGIKILAGASLLDVFSKQNNILVRPLLTEKWMGTWGVSYKLTSSHVTIDYTGNIYGPMRLPRLGDSDPRSEYSPVWSLQNIQLTYGGFKKLEIYGGVKNLLNWKPGKNEPFLIANSRDPFDKNVHRDASGGVISSPENPYALSFDPGYVYAPNQGIRAFLGLRYTLR
ncbi:outer membrane receptor for ferrienterochelin and colicins [Daejeonella rubra]|uniref:Outer membrane receptor for ferrienterochelin and colicins n=1 Tax=Daejeonella rubra TaxID=990371 RepID=A0A1G9LW45_9SPHI|nr:TonB-dependent receptor [Daejeonella rubra]SDL65947.1 outer membrane receptor for ferrienterochelin and colicins [Daejeonella rubra]